MWVLLEDRRCPLASYMVGTIRLCANYKINFLGFSPLGFIDVSLSSRTSSL